GETEIEQHDVERLGSKQVERLPELPRMHEIDGPPLGFAKHLADQTGVRIAVLDEQNLHDVPAAKVFCSRVFEENRYRTILECLRNSGSSGGLSTESWTREAAPPRRVPENVHPARYRAVSPEA